MTEPNPRMVKNFLTMLRAGQTDAVLLTLASQGSSSPDLVQLGVHLSENNDPAIPEDPAAENWCGFCGGTGDLEPVEPDFPEKVCTDLSACLDRRERRYPPDMNRVPLWLLAAQQRGEVADLVRASADAAARELLELAGQMPPDMIALTSVLDPEPPRHTPCNCAACARLARQAALPPPVQPPAHDPWHRTLRHPAARAHLISKAQPAGGDMAAGQVPNQPLRPVQQPDQIPRRRGRAARGRRRR